MPTIHRLTYAMDRQSCDRFLASETRNIPALKIEPACRQDAGLTQPQMAKRLGISQPTLNRLENAGQNTTLKTLNQLCRALRCRAGDLFEPGQLKVRAGRARDARH